jgi:hypothetical protein
MTGKIGCSGNKRTIRSSSGRKWKGMQNELGMMMMNKRFAMKTKIIILWEIKKSSTKLSSKSIKKISIL